jgi:hypothetical protein
MLADHHWCLSPYDMGHGVTGLSSLQGAEGPTYYCRLGSRSQRGATALTYQAWCGTLPSQAQWHYCGDVLTEQQTRLEECRRMVAP